MKKVSPKKRTMGTMKRGLAVTDFAEDFIAVSDTVLKINKVILPFMPPHPLRRV